jgi:hypothetical protein
MRDIGTLQAVQLKLVEVLGKKKETTKLGILGEVWK